MEEKRRIICIGNRYIEEDSAGPRVFDILAAGDLPGNVEVIDGGTSGIGLLRFGDGAARLVFVDSVTGFGPPGSVVDLTPHDVLATSRPEPHGHGSGLDFLLRALPIACEGPVPEVIVVGVETPGKPQDFEEAARLSLMRAIGR